MRASLVACVIFSFSGFALAQDKELAGTVLETNNSSPVDGATVVLLPGRESAVTDENGKFFFKNVSPNSSISITSIGHQPVTIPIEDFLTAGRFIFLSSKTVQLSEVRIASNGGEPYRTIGNIDIKTRGINNSQEVLRIIPGLFIGQHAGGGKAEQIFLRGFDLDHGTDINITVDGMPVNMVSHAHGQGYSDLHFLIPELIDNITFKKGPYYAEKGNFTTTGYVDFRTMNSLERSFLKLEGGMFNTFRTVAAVNLLNENPANKTGSAYLASECMTSGGYFDHPQNFNRINLFGKWVRSLGKAHHINISSSTFYSKWNASGQIPDRAVETGMIGFYGAIDPNEGGNTSRTNLNIQLTSSSGNNSYFKNQLFYSNYHFDLFSNFTFYKNDPVNGDQIRQKEKRHLIGYNGSYHKTSFVGKAVIKSEAGINIRMDKTINSELSYTKERNFTLDPKVLGNISEKNFAGYINETVSINSSFTFNAGLRYDYFTNTYLDKLNNRVKENATASILSPKFSFYYNRGSKSQLYLSAGKGFHSNDTRVVVPQYGIDVLPAAYGIDIGTILKPKRHLLIHAALWFLWMGQEFVYVGDEAVIEPGGRSKRVGADLSIRYQPFTWLYADMDLNYAHGRAVKEPKGQDYLPLAPIFTSTGGITVKTKAGINASLRYRYMCDRPANDDYTIVAKGYFITHAFINFPRKKYEIGLSVQNLFNVKWKETQFETESRLKDESFPVSEIHFTAGTPLFAKLAFTYLF